MQSENIVPLTIKDVIIYPHEKIQYCVHLHEKIQSDGKEMKKLTFETLTEYIIDTIYSKKKVFKINSIKDFSIGGTYEPHKLYLIKVYANVIFKEKNKEYPINSTYTISIAEKELKVYMRNKKLINILEI